MDHIWEIRNPDGGATGLEFSRARLAAHELVLGHALPERVDVEVRDMDGRMVARAQGLRAEGSPPMSRLRIRDGHVQRENVWPSDGDLGLPVILAGGEVGILLEWWNAPD